VSAGPFAYLAFTVSLGVVFAGLVVYYMRPSRRARVEAPKYRMLEDEGPAGPCGASEEHDRP